MTKLQINKRRNVEAFFEQLSSKEKLIRYKNAVPFVHIPDELIAQWDSFSRIKKSWYREIWTQKEWMELSLFDEFFNKKLETMPKWEQDLDVPEILQSKNWIEIMERAQQLKAKIWPVNNSQD